MSQRRLVALFVFAAAACGTPPTASDEPPAASSGAEAPRVVDRSGPAIVECEEALHLGVDLARIEGLRDALAPRLGEAVLGYASELTGTDPETVTTRRVLEAWGLARSGVVELVLCAPDANVRARVAALEALAPAAPNTPGSDADFARASAVATEGQAAFLAAHATLPVADGGALLARLDAAFEDDRLVLPGYERVYFDRSNGMVLGVSRAPGALSIELLVDPVAGVVDSTQAAFAARAEVALRMRGRPGTLGRSLDLEGADARFVESPASLVDTSEWLGFAAVLRAVEGADGALRAQLYAQGAYEATRARALVDEAGGRAFERVDAHLVARGRSTFRAEARTPAALADEAAFHPASRIEVSDAGAFLAATPSFLHAFPFPGRTRAAFEETRRLAGGLAMFIAAPSWILERLADVFDDEAGFRDETERARADALFEDVVLLSDVGGQDATLALVAPGADPKAALCSLVVSGERCPSQVRVGRPFSPDGEHTLLLATAGGRAVAIVASDAASARRAAARVTVAPGTTPVRALISEAMMRDSDLAEIATGLCGSARLGVERDGDALVVFVDRDPCTGR